MLTIEPDQIKRCRHQTSLSCRVLSKLKLKHLISMSNYMSWIFEDSFAQKTLTLICQAGAALPRDWGRAFEAVGWGKSSTTSGRFFVSQLSEVQSIVMEVKVNHFRMLLRQSKSETGKMSAHLFAPPSTRPRLAAKGCPLRRDTRTWTFTISYNILKLYLVPKISWSTM